jgi:hypothetical protein
MTGSVTERVAEAIHDGWWIAMQARGYSLGPRDRENRTHPHLLPWSACGPDNNNQDRFEAALVLHYLHGREGTDPSVRPTDDEVAAQIHDAWVEYMMVEGRGDHPHAHHRWEDHDDAGRTEHLEQARQVLRVWEDRPWKTAE